jgi:uncharacterized protein YjlB
MQRYLKPLIYLCAIFVALSANGGAASAQTFNAQGVPVYNAWQPAWDQYVYDHRHVVLGEVIGFQPYRVQIRHRDGNVQNVDLKNGTVILPTGATPAPGEHVALLGYYSHGTFIVNRLVIR